MKLNKIIKLASIALITIFAFNACESNKAGNKTDQNNMLIFALLNQAPEPREARKYCGNAVVE